MKVSKVLLKASIRFVLELVYLCLGGHTQARTDTGQ